jgi:hypothetical protein
MNNGFVSLDQPCYQDAKGRTYRQVLGKDFKAGTLLEDTESGRVVEIIKPSEHGEALKARGVSAEKPMRRSEGERERQKAAKLESAYRERVLAAIREKTPASIAGADLRLIANALWQMAGHEERVRLVKLWNWAEKGRAADIVYKTPAQLEKLSEADLRRFVIDCALIDEVRANPYDTRKPTKLLDIAKRLKIDLAKVKSALKDERLAKESTRAPRLGKAPAKTKLTAKKAAH